MFFYLIYSVFLVCWLDLNPLPSVFMNDEPTTFRTCNKTAEKVRRWGLENDIGQTLLRQPICQNCREIIQRTDFPQMYFSNNGFVRTVMDAYNEHHNLIIRPDDVWAAIMTQFSFYVNHQEKEFREKFVDFEDQKKLTVVLKGSLENFPLVELFGQEIEQHLVNREVKDWILPDFSTTTENDRVSVGVIFMATVKKFFSFRVFAACGIPEVTLEGTLEDWEEILTRVEKLKEYRLETWYTFLKSVIQQFVEVKKGNVDLDFWQKIVSYLPLGSKSAILSGWITVFCAFDAEGRWLSMNPQFVENDIANGTVLQWPTIDTKDIPTGIVEVDVTVQEADKTEYEYTLLAGHFGTEVKNDGVTVQPALGWALSSKL